MLRRIMQIAVAPAGDDEPDLYALCNDGTLFALTHSGRWAEMPAIPQDPSNSAAIKMQQTHNEQGAKLRAAEEMISDVSILAGTLMSAKWKGKDAAEHERHNIGCALAKILKLDDDNEVMG